MTGLRTLVLLALCLSSSLGQERSASNERPEAKVWVGRYQEIEEYLRNAECVDMQSFGPSRAARCTLRPGGPVARLAWRPGPPGIYRGFRLSYKSEIAAYEVDKLLNLGMVPPSVERRLDGQIGAAQLWVENVVSFAQSAAPDEATRSRWEDELARMTMFDYLIGNGDRNKANMLRDDAWNLILIDHSRAFPRTTELPRKLTRVDRALWGRVADLTRARLDEALGGWLDSGEIEAILGRREKMKAEVSALVK